MMKKTGPANTTFLGSLTGQAKHLDTLVTIAYNARVAKGVGTE